MISSTALMPEVSIQTSPPLRRLHGILQLDLIILLCLQSTCLYFFKVTYQNESQYLITSLIVH